MRLDIIVGCGIPELDPLGDSCLLVFANRTGKASQSPFSTLSDELFLISIATQPFDRAGFVDTDEEGFFDEESGFVHRDEAESGFVDRDEADFFDEERANEGLESDSTTE
jgi:hypothetical protein